MVTITVTGFWGAVMFGAGVALGGMLVGIGIGILGLILGVNR